MAAVGKTICSGDGSDCPCHTAEKSRPVPGNKDSLTLVPIKVICAIFPKILFLFMVVVSVIFKCLPGLQVTVEPGKSVYGCTCGQSKNFPYCDGSHRYASGRACNWVLPRIRDASPRSHMHDGYGLRVWLQCIQRGKRHQNYSSQG